MQRTYLLGRIKLTYSINGVRVDWLKSLNRPGVNIDVRPVTVCLWIYRTIKSKLKCGRNILPSIPILHRIATCLCTTSVFLIMDQSQCSWSPATGWFLMAMVGRKRCAGQALSASSLWSNRAKNISITAFVYWRRRLAACRAATRCKQLMVNHLKLRLSYFHWLFPAAWINN